MNHPSELFDEDSDGCIEDQSLDDESLVSNSPMDNDSDHMASESDEPPTPASDNWPINWETFLEHVHEAEEDDHGMSPFLLWKMTASTESACIDDEVNCANVGNHDDPNGDRLKAEGEGYCSVDHYVHDVVEDTDDEDGLPPFDEWYQESLSRL